MKAIYFDMDGTIADLYGYENWLSFLRNEDTTPYEKCNVLVNVEELRQVLNEFLKMGITLGIISWGAMNGSREYCRRTRKAKIEWCERHFPNVFTEYHVIKYGTPKHYVRKIKDSILVDDNENVRESWKGETINANENIVELLRELLKLQQNKNHENYLSGGKIDKAEEQGLFSDRFNQNYERREGLYMIGQTTFNPITNEKRYWVKVGLTTNPHQRIRSYLTHDADVYFIDWFSTKNYEWYESSCHRQLSKISLFSRTEWFKVSEKIYFELCEEGFSHNMFNLNQK